MFQNKQTIGNNDFSTHASLTCALCRLTHQSTTNIYLSIPDNKIVYRNINVIFNFTRNNIIGVWVGIPHQP